MPDIASAIEQSHAALQEIVCGDAGGFRRLYADGDEVTLGNPFGPFARGREQVVATVTAAAERYRDGQVDAVELIAQHVTDELACVVEVERFRAKVGGSDELSPVSLRVTSVFRNDGGAWRLVHRHADPITTARPASSIVQP